MVTLLYWQMCGKGKGKGRDCRKISFSDVLLVNKHSELTLIVFCCMHTNSMEQRPFWRANSLSATWGIPCPAWNLNVNCSIHASPSHTVVPWKYGLYGGRGGPDYLGIQITKGKLCGDPDNDWIKRGLQLAQNCVDYPRIQMPGVWITERLPYFYPKWDKFIQHFLPHFF
jgi:hypothetical protein